MSNTDGSRTSARSLRYNLHNAPFFVCFFLVFTLRMISLMESITSYKQVVQISARQIANDVQALQCALLSIVCAANEAAASLRPPH